MTFLSDIKSKTRKLTKSSSSLHSSEHLESSAASISSVSSSNSIASFTENIKKSLSTRKKHFPSLKKLKRSLSSASFHSNHSNTSDLSLEYNQNEYYSPAQHEPLYRDQEEYCLSYQIQEKDTYIDNPVSDASEEALKEEAEEAEAEEAEAEEGSPLFDSLLPCLPLTAVPLSANNETINTVLSISTTLIDSHQASRQEIEHFPLDLSNSSPPTSRFQSSPSTNHLEVETQERNEQDFEHELDQDRTFCISPPSVKSYTFPVEKLDLPDPLLDIIQSSKLFPPHSIHLSQSLESIKMVDEKQTEEKIGSFFQILKSYLYNAFTKTKETLSFTSAKTVDYVHYYYLGTIKKLKQYPLTTYNALYVASLAAAASAIKYLHNERVITTFNRLNRHDRDVQIASAVGIAFLVGGIGNYVYLRNNRTIKGSSP
ncbi:unnamed protein product [Pichia kudriavzevii]